MAESRLRRLDDGRYEYTPKKGVSFTVTAPQLVRRLVSLVPPAKTHLTSFHGVYAPHAALRPIVTAPPPPPAPTTPKKKRRIRPARRLDWASLTNTPSPSTSCAARPAAAVGASSPCTPPVQLPKPACLNSAINSRLADSHRPPPSPHFPSLAESPLHALAGTGRRVALTRILALLTDERPAPPSTLTRLRAASTLARSPRFSLCFTSFRLEVMAETSDGFEIAEPDLEIRGPGWFLGTRQRPARALANLARDQDLLSIAQVEARAIVEKDPDLARPEHLRLRKALEERWEDRLQLARVG